MHRRKLRIFAAALALSLCAQPVLGQIDQMQVYAAYLPDAFIDDYLGQANQLLQEIQDNFNQTSTGQSGLLERLSCVERYGMVIYYLEEYKAELNLNDVTVSDSIISQYRETFLDMCNQFNASFNKKKSTAFVPLALDITDDNTNVDARLKKQIDKLCTKTVPTYLTDILSTTKTKTANMAQNKILAEYGVLLSDVVSVLDCADDLSDDLTNISPYKSKTNLKAQVDFNTCIDLATATASLWKDYNDLLNVGESVLAMTGSSAVISVDPSLGFVANMANVTESDGNVVIPDGVQLSQAYLAIEAAGATYVPFKSYVGESSFMAALKSLVPDDSAVDNLVEFYDDTKSFRKPLYKRVLSNTGEPTGVAKLITVQDFLTDIKDGNEGALVTIGGKFTYDTKNNYWVYADTYKTNQDNEELDTPTDDQDFSEISNENLEESSVSESEAQQAAEEAEEQQQQNGGSNSGSGSGANSGSGSGANSGSGSTGTSRDPKITFKYETITDNYLNDLIYTVSKGNISCKYHFYVKKAIVNYYIYADINYENKDNGKSSSIKGKKIAVGASSTNVITTVKTWLQCEESVLEIPAAYRITKNATLDKALDQNPNGKIKGTKTPVARKVLTDMYQALGGTIEASASESIKPQGLSLTINATTVPEGTTSGGGGGQNLDGGNAETTDPGTGTTDPGTGTADPNAGATDPNAGTTDPNAGTTDPDSVASGETGTGGETEPDSSQDPDNGEQEFQQSSTVTTTINTNELSGMSVAATDVPGIMADKTITSEDKMSEPIVLYGAKHARETDNMTTLVMRNIITGTVGIENMYNESNDYLYVNPYGDILTDDGMVILPGIANPIMYSVKEEYNPYTAAFMNYYPSVLENTSFFQVASANDVGKMLIVNDSAHIRKDGTINPDSLVTNKAEPITSISDIKPTAPISVPEIETTFYYNDIQQEQILGYDRLIFGDTSTWSEDGTGMYAYTPLLIKKQLSTGGTPIFPYNVDDDRDIKDNAVSAEQSSYSSAKMIAQNVFHYLTFDITGTATNLNRLNDNYIVYYFCVSNLNGTSNPLAYANADTYTYDRYVSDAEIRKESTLVQVSTKILDSLGNADQIIGIKTSSQDAILGPAFAFIKEHWLMCFMLLAIVLLFGFARIQRDAYQSIMLMAICMVFAYTFVYVIPTYLPLVYNSIINNVSENLAYEVMAVKTESNDIEKNDVVAVDDNGYYKFDTSSLNLFRVGSHDLRDFYKSLGVTEKDVVGGKTMIINQEAGLFVEGDSIKINADVLFKTLEITGTYNADDSTYQFESTKTVSNNMDYYTPYYQFVDNFIDKLNALASIYAIPRSMTQFSDDVVKDNYIVYSYVNSMPFLTPGIYDSFTPEDTSLLQKDDLTTLMEDQQTLAKQLTQVFGDEDTAKDWLGISSFLYDLDPDYRNTLWAQTMYDNGYYYYDTDTKEDWVPNKEMITDLVNYVNAQTKKFIFSLDDQIGSLSDDVMIKIITLRELTAFTQCVSDIGHWLYPFSLNYQEMTLKDVINCTFVNDYYKFVSDDLDIVSYILHEYGWLHLILFDALVILLFIISSVVHFAVPLMYLLLGALIIVKLITNADIKVPLKGYLKCTIITMMCSTVVCAGIVLANKLNGSVICIYFMIAILILVATVLTTIMTSLITNLADFGNTAINAKAEGISESFNRFGYKVQNTNILARNVQGRKQLRNPQLQANDMASRYSSDRRVDDFYDDYRPGGSGYYSNEAPFDQMYEPEMLRETESGVVYDGMQDDNVRVYGGEDDIFH